MLEKKVFNSIKNNCTINKSAKTAKILRFLYFVLDRPIYYLLLIYWIDY